ncbi:MAG: SDR family oxidoreductase [Acidobacteriota bacterium]|nr:SDR family oxidoreductase [Acidobacteriota bacterium]
MQVLVIGGTLFIGRALVTELVKAGHDVSILHRKPKHDLGNQVANIQGDRNNLESLKSALVGKNFEAVFDNVYDWDHGTTAAQVEATARLTGDRLQRYVFMSSVAVYGDGLSHREEDTLVADDHSDAYARNKAASERALFRMHQRDKFPAVTLRPAFVYGPANPYYREAFFWDRLRDNRPIILPGDGRRLMQFTYVDDLVRCCMNALTTPDAVGHACNVANPRPLTQLEVVDALALSAGKKPNYVRFQREKILEAGGHPMGPKLYFGMYFDLPQITMATEKMQRLLRVAPTEFTEGLKDTHRWYEQKRPFPPPDYTFENELIATAPPSAYAAPER